MTSSMQRQWSEEGSSGSALRSPVNSQTQNSQRSLAPAADIRQSQVKRRPQQPNSATANLGLTISSTPPRRQPQPKLKQRTPSQNAAMEADAIEGLLFMSSPGNTGHHPYATTNSSQTSPLRSQFAPSDLTPKPRRVQHGYSSSITGHAPRNGQDIDRVLDEMSSESSVDGDETAFLQKSGMGSLGTVHS